MKILVIDGLGGSIGKSIVGRVRVEFGGAEIIAVGTNALATSAMLKAGADFGATGENAVVHNSSRVDCIIGALGIVLANSMHGEISPEIAKAVSGSLARKILIPINSCNVVVTGVSVANMQEHMGEIVRQLKQYCEEKI